ncbi:MAG: glycosyltransferase [Miltoncostaeaceae bacterium]
MAPSTRTAGPTRVDLHLHSRASTDTGSWFVSRASMPESHTEPATAYATAKARGMDVVTLTDHNTIAGALEIAHHPDVLIGVEVTTRFPEDGVPLHVLVWGVDEARWADIDRLRPNLHEMLGYLEAADLPCALAHPLHRVGDDLSPDHIERCLLLFGLWEGINGARPRLTNEVAARIARSAQRSLMERLADKHGIPPRAWGPPGLVGGSDDHGSFDIANAWTELPPAATPAQVLDHLRARRVHPGGGHGSAEALAHSVGALATCALVENGTVGLPEPMRGILADVLQRPMRPPARPDAAGQGVGAGMAGEMIAGVRRDPRLVRRYRRLERAPEGRGRSHARIRLVTGWMHGDLMRRVWSGRGGGLGMRGGAALGAIMTAAPYLLASRYLAGEERFAREIDEAFFGPAAPASGPRRAVMLTDTFSQVNGVAGTMRRLAQHAALTPEAGIRVITCEGDGTADAGRLDLTPLARVPVPGYADADLRLGVPSLIEVLETVRAEGADLVHAATPGPVGVAGMVAARALGIPFVATYHTEFGRYALDLTGDRLAAEVVGRAVAWFYGQADRVYVPTESVATDLRAAGIAPERIAHFGRGIDLDRFGPDRTTRRMRSRMGSGKRLVALYVGRVSREKGVEVLAEAMHRAAGQRADLHLCVVGDGPARRELSRALRGVSHRMMGVLHGADLAAAYAAADMFVFPSATETYGQVVMEAAASGVPAIVCDRGAAHEHVRHGDTGVVVPAGDPGALSRAVLLLADDARLRADLGLRAREMALAHPRWPHVFSALAGSYHDLGAGGAPPVASQRARAVA